jgi:hypothetical protein
MTSALNTVKCYIELEPLHTTPERAAPMLRIWQDLKHEQPLWVVVRTYVFKEHEDGLIHRTCILYPDLPELSAFVDLALQYGARISAIVVEDARMTVDEYSERYGFAPPEPRLVEPASQPMPDAFPGFQTADLLAAQEGIKFRDDSKLRKKRKRKA